MSRTSGVSAQAEHSNDTETAAGPAQSFRWLKTADASQDACQEACYEDGMSPFMQDLFFCSMANGCNG